MRATTTDLTTWIDELRYRARQGHLATLGPIDIGDRTGVLPGERTIRIMLADLDDINHLLLDASTSTHLTVRRRHLLNDFRRLRDLIG